MSKPNTNPNYKFGGVKFRKGAYVKIICTRLGDADRHNVARYEQFAGVITNIGTDYIEMRDIHYLHRIVNIRKQHVCEVYTLYAYTPNYLLRCIRRLVANHNNKKMLKHVCKNKYALHKYTWY